jgi:predicted small metal-binding protein
MKRFNCGDVVPGCDATFAAADEQQILVSVGAHARDDHGLTEVGDDLVAAVRAAIVED